jgi:hypothetical protein
LLGLFLEKQTAMKPNALSLFLATMLLVACGGADPERASDTGDALTSVEASAAGAYTPYFAPALLTVRRTTTFFRDEPGKFAGATEDATCELTRDSGWANERTLERGARFRIDGVRVVGGPRGTSSSRKLGLRGFVDERGPDGDDLGPAKLILDCYGTADGVLPSMSDVSAALAAGGGLGAIDLEFVPSQP